MNKKLSIVILLFMACLISAYLLVSVPKTPTLGILSQEHLDQLIVETLSEQSIPTNQYRVFTAVQDSLFTRKIYRVSTAPSYSKTSFHYALHRKLEPYGVETPARVLFPQKDLHLYVMANETIHRTIRLLTDPSLVIPADTTNTATSSVGSTR